MTTPQFPLLAAALAVGAVLLTGCGSPAAPTATDPVSSPSAAEEAPASGGGEVTTGDDLCARIPVEAADAAVGSDPAITKQAAGSFVDGDPECAFASDDNVTIVVNVTLFADPSGIDPATGVLVDAPAGSGGTAIFVQSFGGTELSGEQLQSLADLAVSSLG